VSGEEERKAGTRRGENGALLLGLREIGGGGDVGLGLGVEGFGSLGYGERDPRFGVFLKLEEDLG